MSVGIEHGEGILGRIGERRFLREYWQRKPLLIRQALPGYVAPIDADELAGLALEEEVESRLVLERGRRGPWELRNGPFSERDFARLPKSRWTLLVQAVDQWVPQVHALREHFAFLPPWRLDDIMISYAADQGGVGPHFDQYDVFLLQAQGRRRWRIGAACNDRTPCRDDTALRILSDFETLEEHVLEPGDLLYIPPGIAHWGIAEGECMTISVGFRAPSEAEILAGVIAMAAERLPEERRYRDPPLRPGVQDGAIPEAAIRRVQRMLRAVADDTGLVRAWFGAQMTTRKYPDLELETGPVPEDIAAWLRAGGVLERHPASRFAFGGDQPVSLFVDGESWPCSEQLARVLCGPASLDKRALGALLRNGSNRQLLLDLLQRGALCCAPA
jgi:50S ribosomal protein L16 3-hydroxylase